MTQISHVGRPGPGRAGGRPTRAGPSRRSADRTEPGVGRPHPSGGRQIADSIAVAHPEGAQREAAESQILLLLGTQRGWNSESAGRPRPTEAKMRSPTPCQEHYQTNTKRGPPEQLFLQSYTGDHGRPADRAPGGQPTVPKWRPPDADSSAVVHSEGVQQDATKSRILLLLGTQ